MTGIFYATITVLDWGTWLVPSQGVQYCNQQIKTLYVTAANFGLAFLELLAQGFDQLTLQLFWLHDPEPKSRSFIFTWY